jgi:hypothetical protein
MDIDDMSGSNAASPIKKLLSNKPLVAGLGAVVAAVVAWLAFGFFGIQSAFLDNEVDEAGPIFDATPTEQAETVETDEFQEAMADAEESRTESDEDMPDDDMPGEIVTVVQGDFAGVSRYTISGDALVLNDGSEQRFLRFENFESSNGPDLKVYLRAADGEFVNLGELKGNIGDQNYEIPADVDLAVFNTVQIWCERFGVEFGNAVLA